MALFAQPPADMTETLFSYDRNENGKLIREELPERMQGVLERADADRDGFLTREELQKATAGMGGGRGGMMMRNPLLWGLDTDQDRKLSAAEVAVAPSVMRRRDLLATAVAPLATSGGPRRGRRGSICW